MRGHAGGTNLRRAPIFSSMSVAMTPVEYANTIALPTIREALGARGDQRLVYLAAIVTYHLADYVARAPGKRPDGVRSMVPAACAAEFEILEGVCNGTKHGGPSRDSRRFQFSPG